MFGKHISLVIYVRGHTYPGETHHYNTGSLADEERFSRFLHGTLREVRMHGKHRLQLSRNPGFVDFVPGP